MKNIIFISFLSLLPFSVFAQTPEKLTGTIIGTAVSVDYTDFQQSTTVNTIANCFDGDLSTYFAAYQRDEGWVGLDLGEKHIIKMIRFCPRTTQAGRVRLGVFEGANNPDFGDAIPLYVVPDAAAENQLTTVAVNSSKGYRYVRYIGRRDVRCNIAELEFWGYAGEGDNSRVGQLTALPTIAIHTTNNQVINSRENYLKGIVSIIDGDYFHTDSLDVRGRGNASWQFPKKPYRMRLYNRTRLLGNPANERVWTLINNYGDKTLMRNLIAFNISEQMDMSYTSVGRPVDLVVNGEYVGTYQLCDQMEVVHGRIETDAMTAADITLPNLSGGYLVEIDGYAYGSPWDPTAQPEPVKFTSQQRAVPVTVKYPKDDNIVDAQFNYIESHFNAMESALFASNYTDPVNGLRKYMDVPSFIRYFIIGELTGNPDAYWSVYMVKKRNDDKFYFGPVWDFDIAFDNDNRVHPIEGKTEWLFTYTGGAGNVKDYVSRCLSDPQLYNEIKSTYAQYRDSKKLDADSLLAVVDNYAEKIDASQKLNFTRWDILSQRVHQNWGAQGSYAGEVNVLKNYLRNRIAWLDNKLQYVPSPSANVHAALAEVLVFSKDSHIYIRNLTGKTSITCFDISGRVVFESTAENHFERRMPAGIYLVKLESQNGESRVFKCIIN